MLIDNRAEKRDVISSIRLAGRREKYIGISRNLFR